MSNKTNNENPSPEYKLLERIDKRLEGIENQITHVEKTAARSGAIAGGLSGGVVAAGILVAKIKLGL